MTDYATLFRALAEARVEFIVVGGGTYDSLHPDADVIHVFGIECLCLGLERLIQVKRAAGRPKDLDAIAELEAIRDERRRGSDRR